MAVGARTGPVSPRSTFTRVGSSSRLVARSSLPNSWAGPRPRRARRRRARRYASCGTSAVGRSLRAGRPAAGGTAPVNSSSAGWPTRRRPAPATNSTSPATTTLNTLDAISDVVVPLLRPPCWPSRSPPTVRIIPRPGAARHPIRRCVPWGHHIRARRVGLGCRGSPRRKDRRDVRDPREEPGGVRAQQRGAAADLTPPSGRRASVSMSLSA